MNDQEFEKAYEQFKKPLLRRCLFKVSNPDIAEDIVADVFLRAGTTLSKGKEIKNWRAYLGRLLENAIIDYYRKKRTSSLEVLQEGGFDPGFDPTRHIEDRHDGRLILQYLDEIPLMYREVLHLRYIKELSIHEISEIMGDKPNTISTRVHRAIKKVRAVCLSNN